MAFECKVIFWILRFDVLYGHSAFNGTQREARRLFILVQEYAHAAMLSIKMENILREMM